MGKEEIAEFERAENGQHPYYLALAKIAESIGTPIRSLKETIDIGALEVFIKIAHFGHTRPSKIIVLDASKFLLTFSGRKFSIRDERHKDYKTRQGEWKVNVYEKEDENGEAEFHYLLDDIETILKSKIMRYEKWKHSFIVMLAE